MFTTILLHAFARRQWDARAAAQASGLSPARVDALVDGLGGPPTPEELRSLVKALGKDGRLVAKAALWDYCPNPLRRAIFNPWPVLLGRLILMMSIASLLFAVALSLRYTTIPGPVSYVLDRWTGKTYIVH